MTGIGRPARSALARLPGRLSRLWPLSRFQVADESMTPAFRPGDRVVVERASRRWRALRPGDVVVLRDPEAPERALLKRIAAVEGRGRGARYSVLGDNAARSRDSRAFGLVAPRDILGRVWFRY